MPVSEDIIKSKDPSWQQRSESLSAKVQTLNIASFATHAIKEQEFLYYH
jgi:hypothetical protein